MEIAEKAKREEEKRRRGVVICFEVPIALTPGAQSFFRE